MSHDLRKPITAVIEDCRLVLDRNGRALLQPERTVIENIGGNASHLLGMVDEILEMARADARQIEVKPKMVSLASAVGRALGVAEPAARAKGLVLTGEAEPDLEMRTDSGLLSRILENLLGNAVQYTDRGRITLHAKRRGSDLDVAVTDTGRGIPADKFEVIFEKFQRVEATAGITQPGIGLGLGLAISREFARLLGGDIHVESELGKGSVFTLTIPLVYDGAGR
jgi:signal transduction histidine kinase